MDAECRHFQDKCTKEHSTSFGEGEFIKKCLLDVANIICPDKRKDFEQISLSRCTIVRRMQMMADDIKTSLNERITRLKHFQLLWMKAQTSPIQHK